VKKATKVLIVTVALLTALPLVAWTGTFVYWRVKIGKAIQELELLRTPAPTHAFMTLRHDAGCRALPYLVQALEPGKSPVFLERATLLIAIEVADPPCKGDRWSPVIREGEFDWRISLEDSAESRTKKCEMVREYWRNNGSRHHQAWRVWSRACVPND